MSALSCENCMTLAGSSCATFACPQRPSAAGAATERCPAWAGSFPGCRRGRRSPSAARHCARRGARHTWSSSTQRSCALLRIHAWRRSPPLTTSPARSSGRERQQLRRFVPLSSGVRAQNHGIGEAFRQPDAGGSLGGGMCSANSIRGDLEFCSTGRGWGSGRGQRASGGRQASKEAAGSQAGGQPGAGGRAGGCLGGFRRAGPRDCLRATAQGAAATLHVISGACGG